jgi:glycosyltransferase involved in cell wall biosynthesis
MTTASVVVPAYNVAKTLSETLSALLEQTFEDFEIIVVDDGSTDATVKVAECYQGDPRVRIVRQRNRGLAGARNSGIAAARGMFIGFCDADDLWEPEKLEAHVRHLQNEPHIGVSYSGSALIDEDGAMMGQAQAPRLRNVDIAHILKRNPIGNGSAPVIRKAVFDAIAYRPAYETERDWYFDETFRQSEDIECWLRIALTTDWGFEGVPGLLTRYRVNAGGLSANTARQLESWENMTRKLQQIAPELFARHLPAARAYQLRYLARRAVSDLDGKRAMQLACASLRQSLRPFIEEPTKTLITCIAALVLRLGGERTLRPLLAGRGTRT